MKKLLVVTALMLAGVAAKADVTAIYGQWTDLPNCGGQTLLQCDGPRQANQCHVYFRNSYGCNTIKMYVASNFYPKAGTFESNLKGEFYVDNAKVGGFWVPKFYAFLDVSNQGTSNTYERITYYFNY